MRLLSKMTGSVLVAFTLFLALLPSQNSAALTPFPADTKSFQGEDRQTARADVSPASAAGDSGVYIVEVEGDPAVIFAQLNGVSDLHHPAVKEHRRGLREVHHRILGAVSRPSVELLYHYTTVLNGFAVHLPHSEAAALKGVRGVLSVRISKLVEQHTTHSWSFLGLDSKEPTLYSQPSNGSAGNSVWKRSKAGKGIIIGLIDTGIWPEHPSFSPKGMPPPPKKWKGICQEGDQWTKSTCNNKIVGARYFNKGHQKQMKKGFSYKASGMYLSPRDDSGHGSHTASTAAGNRIRNVLFGYPVSALKKTVMSGVAYNAHIAVYKVCWNGSTRDLSNGESCSEVDVMSAVDLAVRDGVDVVSMSIGSASDYLSDNAKATLAAAMAGVFVSMSAGNEGPGKFTVGNGWPWQTTVGASTTDRKFISKLILGNGVILEGASLHSEGVSAPIVYGGHAARKGVPPSNASFCMNGTLDAAIVKGKIVLCNRGYGERNPKALAVRAAGGVGFVLRNTEDYSELFLDYYVIPMTHVTMKDGDKILDYIKSTKNPSAEIKGAESIARQPRNPSMGIFSSQGPNQYQPNLGKPDVTAPGVDIFAAMSASTNFINFEGRIAPVSWLPDRQPQYFMVMSGTSMSCPHVSGIAANIKHLHPDWSQAMIRSAIMTTATVLDNTNNIISDFFGDPADARAFGAGHVNPRAALDPGLVYDTRNEDYISYICSLVKELQGTFDCSRVATAPNNFNYPSLTVTVARNSTFQIRASRTLTNVVKLKVPEVYRSRVEILGRSHINVTITPSELQFSQYMEEQKYDIIIAPDVSEEMFPDGYTWGRIKWTSNAHTVSIPLQLMANNA